MQTINNLEKLIALSANQAIQSYTTKSLIGPGENYASTILDVAIIVRDVDKNATKTLHCVVKLCPRSEFLKIAFNIPITFRKEVRFYHVVVPLLERFQKEQGLDELITSFAACYGSRLSLNPSTDVVDDDAAIVLENLKLNGYTLGDRMVGFDFETSKLILEDLAAFHAVPMALKLLKPDVFNRHVLPSLENNVVFQFGDDLEERTLNSMINNLRTINIEESVVERVKVYLEKGAKFYRTLPDPSPLFATIGHNDLWTNNTMVKFEDGKPIKNVLLDFQLIRYCSLANDVILFLYTSVRSDVIGRLDALLKIYYEKFISILEKFQCDTGPFTYDLFIEEIKSAVRNSEMFHILIMLKPIHTLKSKITSLDEFAMEDLFRNDNVSETFGVKVFETVNDLAKRGWI